MKIKVAVASTDGKVVNQHFGKAAVFYIVMVDSENKGWFELQEIRQLTPLCEGGDHSDTRLSETVERLKDCACVLVSRIGYRAANAVEAAGIRAFEIPGMIGESIEKMQKYMEIQKLIDEMSGKRTGEDSEYVL